MNDDISEIPDHHVETFKCSFMRHFLLISFTVPDVFLGLSFRNQFYKLHYLYFLRTSLFRPVETMQFEILVWSFKISDVVLKGLFLHDAFNA